ncbi:MAG TPA: GntR family transcriptional regulator [Microbacterium sp.]|uniref:GntR family transcriptional regulator n=1 Tax=Microbacterium sp. TaxID=51671 RepID=UPI002BD2100D|nr:GntR family transcriptional regulator [Microbacterium sp.]HWI31484.1 GntR family transcriptional regulator [Microbacterium sp.]
MSTENLLSSRDPRSAVLGDEIYTILGEAIRDGRLTPGQRLRDIELAAALGVSRTPVREALQRLERIGLVDVSPNRYTRVSVPDEKVLADTYEYLIYSMAFGLRMSLARCSDDELSAAIALADGMIEASTTGDVAALVRASYAFYEHISKTTGNVVFQTIMREAGPAFGRNLDSWRPASVDPPQPTVSYGALRDAVAARDGAEAERIMRIQHDIS